MSYIGQVPLPQATEERIEKTATAGQTLFTGLTYVNGFISVYLNGVKLDNADFTATDGTTVTLGTGAAAGDTVSFVSTTQTSGLMALPLKDSAGNSILSESGGVVALTADNLVVIDGSQTIDSSDANGYARFTHAGGNAQLGLFRSGDSVGGGYLGGNSDASLMVMDSSFSEKVRIDSSGNLLVATNSVTTGGSSGKFVVQFNGATGNGIKITDSNTGSGNDNVNILFQRNGSTVGKINTTTSTTGYNTTSDYRLKENITRITDGIARVLQLNPARFNFIVDPDNTVDGFLAHEVLDIVPEAVSGEKDAVNEDGSIDPQGIDQSKLIPLLTAALQESISLIESQQSQIDALTIRIESLETT